MSNKGTTQYKYLGFKQVWVNSRTTKEDMKKEALRRIRKICGSGLTIMNCGNQLQVSVSPLIGWVAQTITWTAAELDTLNRFVRICLKKNGVLPWRITNGRLYTNPKQGGFGIPNFI